MTSLLLSEQENLRRIVEAFFNAGGGRAVRVSPKRKRWRE